VPSVDVELGCSSRRTSSIRWLWIENWPIRQARVYARAIVSKELWAGAEAPTGLLFNARSLTRDLFVVGRLVSDPVKDHHPCGG